MTEKAQKEQQSKANDYKEKFDAQKPLIQELTVQIADKETTISQCETKIQQCEKQLQAQKGELQQQLEAQKMVSQELQRNVQSSEQSLEEMDFLRKQVIDKDNRVQELLLEKTAIEEQYSKEVDEITETGVTEISELEGKLEQAQEDYYANKQKHSEEVQSLKANFTKQNEELKAQIQAMQLQMRNASEKRLEVSA